jgi:hypothetical protein
LSRGLPPERLRNGAGAALLADAAAGRLAITHEALDGHPGRQAADYLRRVLTANEALPPSANFTNAKTSFLADDPARWPGHFIVSGFSYDRLEQPQGLPPVRTWDHRARCAWLRRQDTYDAGPYEQAARAYRQHGYTAGARAIPARGFRDGRVLVGCGRRATGRPADA